MANEQHIEWLLEGVAAWNTRRQTSSFIPDLSEMTHAYFNDKMEKLIRKSNETDLKRIQFM